MHGLGPYIPVISIIALVAGTGAAAGADAAAGHPAKGPVLQMAESNTAPSGRPDGAGDADRCQAPADPSAPKPMPDQGYSPQSRTSACNGMLKAPGVGDDGMVKPAPDIGKGRIIKPGTPSADPNG